MKRISFRIFGIEVFTLEIVGLELVTEEDPEDEDEDEVEEEKPSHGGGPTHNFERDPYAPLASSSNPEGWYNRKLGFSAP